MADLDERLSTRISYGRWVLACGSLALLLYLYTTATGLAATFDSYYYLYAAQTLRQSGQLLMPDGSPYRVWPPLFPTVLWLIGAPGPVRWLNGVALLGALVAWSAVGRQLLPAGRAWALPLLLALGTPALVVSKFIWSESLFNLLWASYFLLLIAWLRRGGWGLGLLATVLGCLLPLQRIAGLFLLAGVGMGLVWPGAARLVRPSRWAQLGHLGGAVSGLALQQLLGWPDLASGTLMQAHAGKAARLLSSLADYGFVLGRWLVPLPVAGLRLLPIAGWVAVLALVLLVLWPRPARSPASEIKLVSWPVICARMLFMGLLVSVGLLAVATMLQRIGNGLHEAERYLTPLYPPVVLLLLLAWPVGKHWSSRVGARLLLAWTLYQGVRVGHNAHQLRQLAPADPAVGLKLTGKQE